MFYFIEIDSQDWLVMRMDLNSLYYFIVVTEELSFTKAANRLYLSQQAVSSQIKKLEEEYGVALFYRKPTLKLTSAGTSLYHTAIEIFRLHQNFQNEVSNITANDVGQIRLGISYGRARVFLPEIIQQMKLRCPNVQLKVLERMSSTRMEQDLLSYDTDFYIGLTPTRSSQINPIVLRRDSVILVVPKPMMNDFRKTKGLSDDELFSDHFSINALGKYPFVLPSQENNLRFMFNHYIRTLNFLPNILMESDQSDTPFFLSLEGVGISIYPEVTFSYWQRCLSSEALARVEVIPLSNLTESKIILGYKKQRHMSQVDNVFVDLCRNLSYFDLT